MIISPGKNPKIISNREEGGKNAKEEAPSTNTSGV